ncbi:MAG: 23S rRNA (pseudouridine(1915)-N(3))-methyltransferase RlmH [Aestuariivita sp.]|nr:23S rRNA (pseudouridine(1915)-N(3))-methyltransferase RlmH [Aestuariivita sp.]
MRIYILAIGKLRHGPECELLKHYLSQFDKVGRVSGLGPSKLVEIVDKKSGGQEIEAGLLRNAIPSSSTLCVLDERGRAMTSPEFATWIGRLRDGGIANLAMLIGGAGGIDSKLRSEADLVLSLGPMVWPHILVRVMLAEQIFRAASILARKPYHRH